MDRYTLYCTPEQTKKAFELGAPIKYKEVTDFEGHVLDYNITETPTAEQMLGWLRKQGVKFLFSDEPDVDGDYWFVGINKEVQTSGADKENKELAAIDTALEYLSNNKK